MTAQHLELPITGMTCASCANRIERKLNTLDGVTATVNYATERATVAYDATAVEPEQLVAAVEAAGYSAALPQAAADAPAEPEDETAALRQRLLISLALMLPVLAMAMIPPLQFESWQWLSLTLAAPVVVWGAWPFHRAAWVNLKHATATMDTLISVGVLAAFGWSLYALFIGDAGMPGMTMGFDLIPERGAAADEIYLEVATAVTVFILAGRYFEARAKRRAGAALTALLELGAKDVAILGEDGAERRVPVEQLQVGDRFVVRPGEKVATDGVVESGMLRRRPVPAHRRVRPGREAARRRRRRGERERGRPAGRARDEDRRGHRARADRPAGHRGAVRQGARAAARRPDLGRLRPGRDRDRGRHARLLDRQRRGPRVRLHRRRRGADHRLPVRARARHADRAARRHGPRRPARAADQGPGDPRVHAPRRHDRARQDRHGDHRAAWRWRRSSGGDGVDEAELLAVAGALEDASEHPIAPRDRRRGADRVAARRSSPSSRSSTARASASRASSAAAASRSAARR